MTSEEEKTLELLLKKQKEEEQRTAESGAPVLQLIPGGGERNKMADILERFAAMARRGELYDVAVIGVLASGYQAKAEWGSQVPSLPLCGAVGAIWLQLNAALQRT